MTAVLNRFIHATVPVATAPLIEWIDLPRQLPLRPFTSRRRYTLLAQLNARQSQDESVFDEKMNLRAVRSLERLARRYKQSDDSQSLREIVRLLVAASGHDVHAVRDRANVALERVFAPKEFEAPLATSFVNLRRGATHHFAFELPRGKARYFVRLYLCSQAALPLERDMRFVDLDLHYETTTDVFAADYRFAECGHYDYLVYQHKNGRVRWLGRPGCSGRINVMPDVRGEVVLEVFVDIHGHTRAYWRDETGHPGLVYNEHGEVIRLGRFADVTAHLDDLKERYCITALYLLGVQKRGRNRADWTPEATSPSPFAPMSLTEIEPSLGGPDELRELVGQAHARDIKVIVDVMPHLNRDSTAVPAELAVQCHDGHGNLVVRASTDGRYGSWNDGKLLNYRKLEVWEWLTDSICTLIDTYDIDGLRFDSCHAVPIMMKKHNEPTVQGRRRTHADIVEGTIIVNDREDDHFITTGYYDCACREAIASPFHSYVMRAIERKLKEKGKGVFVTLAECYWGRERFLARAGIIPYNAALFKICEHIIHGRTDVREIYHVYDNYFPSVLPPGTELLGILSNHDERRALNTFGQHGLRAAVALTSFLSGIIMDYEGSAEGESWKVYPDNIYVDWNQFEYASHRSLEPFYRDLYARHRKIRGQSCLIWANNPLVAAAMKGDEAEAWIGVFNFADSTQTVSLQFDHPALPIDDSAFYQILDTMYSSLTGHSAWYTGQELRSARLHTVVSYTDRVKFFRVVRIEQPDAHYNDFLRDSFGRLCALSEHAHVLQNFAFREIASRVDSFDGFTAFVSDHLVPLGRDQDRQFVGLGCKRALYHLVRAGLMSAQTVYAYLDRLRRHEQEELGELGRFLHSHMQPGPLVFIAAEVEPFSKAGGIANVVSELPQELVGLGEEAYVITPLYRSGDEQAASKRQEALQQYEITYTGTNVRFKIEDTEYEVGVHAGTVNGVSFFLLDHHEFFDGLYWGFTAAEKLRRRIAFARACAELIVVFGLQPIATFANDAYAGIFNGIIRSDPVYADNPNFQQTSFFHIIHNGGWQYFDCYDRYDRDVDHFRLFNLPAERAGDFADPNSADRINCMAAGVRFADRVITMSPTYAKQLVVAGDGLEHVLHEVTGINNGVRRDFLARMCAQLRQSGFVDNWYPRLRQRLREDALLHQKVERRYPELLTGAYACESIRDPIRRAGGTRMRNKLLLQLERGLVVDPDRILFVMFHRLVEQKGFQLLLEASEGIFKQLGYQGLLGGPISSFDPRGEELARGLELLQEYYPDQVSVSLGLQDVCLPLLAADIFLMPSLYEPGGIAQLEAVACGCLVVARATGGLLDTIQPLTATGRTGSGNGFLFTDPSPQALYDVMERCARFLQAVDERRLQEIRSRVQRSAYDWDQAARRYLDEIYATKEIVRISPPQRARASQMPNAA